MIALSLLAVSTVAKAQYEVYLEQSPTSDLSTVEGSLNLQEIASALGLGADDLRSGLATEIFLKDLDGRAVPAKKAEYVDDYYGDDSFLLSEDGHWTGYSGNEKWFLYVDTDETNMVFHVGQCPSAFAGIAESKTLETVLTMENGVKRVTFLVTLKVKSENGDSDAKEWTMPVPQFEDMSTSSVQYLYNVDFNGCFLGANEYTTRASVSKSKGYQVQMKYQGWSADNETWGIYNYVEENYNGALGKWLYTFCDNATSIWVDNNNGANWNQWVFTFLDDNMYEITNPAAGDGKLGATQYYDGVESTRLYLISGEDEKMTGDTYTKWAFISPFEYEKWCIKNVKYEAARTLNNYITDAEAKYDGIDFSDPKAVYANTLASLSELEEALETAREIVTRYRFSDMEEGTDCSELLVNPKFADGFTGWTNLYGNIGGLDFFKNVECYNTVVDCSQTVRGVPTGVYGISVKAFERPAANGSYDGTEASKVSLYMNGFQTPVQNICADAMPTENAQNQVNCFYANPDNAGDWSVDYNVEGKGYVPNSMAGASYAFNAGRYEQTCYGLVGDDGVMKIGLTSNGEICHWVLWADFKLTYMAKNAEAVASVLDVMAEPYAEYVEANVGSMNALAATEASGLIEKINVAKENQDGDALWDALVSLDAAFPAARANVAAMAAYQTAADAITGVSEKTVDAAGEDVQEAYRSVMAQIAKIDELTTDEIVELTATIRTAMQGLDYLVIETAQAGTLGDLVLDYVENFTDVKKLKVVGPINSTDMENVARMTNVTEVDLLETTGLTSLGSTFNSNQKLEYIALPGSLTNINGSAFSGCTNLLKAELGEGITYVSSYMFYGCYRLQSVKLPSTLKEIQSYAFYDCYNLTDFTLPNGLTTIGNYAFYHSSTESRVYVDSYYDANGSWQEVSVSHVTPSALVLPSSVTSIGNYAFYNWRDLTSVDLNEGLTSIGYNAFAGNNVNSVTFPSTLKRISYNVFTGDAITVTCLALIPPTETSSGSFPVSHPGTLYVPSLVTKAYKQATGWDQFNILGMDYVPENILVQNALALQVTDEVFENHKPNVVVSLNNTNTSSGYTEYGALTTSGDGTLSMGNFSIVADPNYQYSYYYYSLNSTYGTLVNNAVMRADQVSTSLWMPANRWMFLSFPYNVNVADIAPADRSTEWVIRTYDGQKRADEEMDNTWVNVGTDDVLEAHKGYIWQMATRVNGNDYGNFYIPAINDAQKNNIFTRGDVEIALNEYQSEYAHNRSWNLIGNPYPSYYDTRAMKFSAPITVWNFNNQVYEAYSPVDDNYILTPNQAFFVQRPVDQESIVFSKEGRQHTNVAAETVSYGAKSRKATAPTNRQVLNLLLSDGERADRTRVVINEAAAVDYELDKDASKFMTVTDTPQFYSYNKGVRYAINERPSANGSVRLGMQLPAAGSYTISLQGSGVENLFLEDAETGEIINLGETDYTFTAQAGINEARFVLHIGEDGATGIQGIGIANADASELYTLDGRRVKGTATSGIYLQKNGQKFQKVYVK